MEGIKENVPRRETGGAMHCGEIFILTMFSIFNLTMNIVTRCYNYFIAHHPMFLLLCYVFAYTLLSFYIYRLTMMLERVQDMNEVNILSNPHVGSSLPKQKRIHTQTKKTTPPSVHKQHSTR